MMTMTPGMFSCGNALHVNDLVDYVSESGNIAGTQAANFASKKARKRNMIPLRPEGDIMYVVPQYLDLSTQNEAIIYFRASHTFRNARLRVYSNGQEHMSKKYRIVKPPEMKRIVLDLSKIPPAADEVRIELKKKEESNGK